MAGGFLEIILRQPAAEELHPSENVHFITPPTKLPHSNARFMLLNKTGAYFETRAKNAVETLSA